MTPPKSTPRCGCRGVTARYANASGEARWIKVCPHRPPPPGWRYAPPKGVRP